MNDQEAIARREKVFEEYRIRHNDLNKLTDKINEKYNEIDALLNEKSKIDDELTYTYKLIATMINHDCCPVEAKLKYPEELEVISIDKKSVAAVNQINRGSAVMSLKNIRETSVSYGGTTLSKILEFLSNKFR